ncbi:MAG: hypothetical protein OH319_04590 [Candidatus Parvarchaeota archaeon]|nr:hypothetical protein [Candidatus Jingweiarchaeum tengchongense]MCW1298666.1 hypothetical protein [Candidatus Jingweiarchaeum tengchongense]MCW1300508.1 hypothetical protein [Candidatus Jingweiarchaeum tengchongense]MCW1304677.1 hypothetical protein [Candidatus Jingweiarchaeum tengchongense]MCW1305866.1 hypothetical protein [Candidatus Jingweiarchaeum tengchongense]
MKKGQMLKPKIKIIGVDILQKRMIKIPYDYRKGGEFLIEIGERYYPVDERLLNKVGDYLVSKLGFFGDYEIKKITYETKTNLWDFPGEFNLKRNELINKVIKEARDGRRADKEIEEILNDESFMPVIGGHRLQRELESKDLKPNKTTDVIALIGLDRLADDSIMSIVLNSNIGEGIFYADRLAGAGDKIPICSFEAYRNIIKETSNKEISDEESAIGIVLHELIEHHFPEFVKRLNKHEGCCLTHPPTSSLICDECMGKLKGMMEKFRTS